MASPPGRALPARVPRATGEALAARADRDARARRAGHAPPRRGFRARRRDRLLGHPSSARRHGSRSRLRERRRAEHRKPDREHAGRRPPGDASGRGDDAGDARRDRARPCRARVARHPGDRLRGSPLHARELRHRRRNLEGLLPNEGLHAVGAGCLETAPWKARHRPGRLPPRPGSGGSAGPSGVRLVGWPGAPSTTSPTSTCTPASRPRCGWRPGPSG